eukprot:TRINITY_DN19048_c0_g1_i8.p1 TRINITY_DN19048_c0_g1~~TRINITY_DN19048_c0_g1_i8.p1  ORF type:complete len:2058 (-),score=330.35 TRINITY_DN19048_c0_g1_i8:145-6318(-)
MCEQCHVPCWPGPICFAVFTLAALGRVIADPALGLSKWSGCGEVDASSAEPLYFQPCAPGEWEVLLTDTMATINNNRNVSGHLALPVASNTLGCAVHPGNHFRGKIALLSRGVCTFTKKVLLAEEAGAVAVVLYDMYDSSASQATAMLGVPGHFPHPRIPGYMVSKSQGLALVGRVESGETVEVVCSFSPIEVWFDLPEYSFESNDSLDIYNYGAADMAWLVATFEHDQFYSVSVAPAPPPFSNGGAPGLVESHPGPSICNGLVTSNLTSDLIDLPFSFPHYLEYKSKVHVTSHGLLVFDSTFEWTSGMNGKIGEEASPAALIAALWGPLNCHASSKIEVATTQSPDDDGVKTAAIRFEGLTPTGSTSSVTFEVWLYSDGRVLILFEDFPADESLLQSFQVGFEPGSGAKSISVTDLPWASGAAFALEMTPWVMIRQNANTVVKPNERVTIDMEFLRHDDLYGWLHFYAAESFGSWWPRRAVRFTQRIFRHFWNVSAWDGGLHNGVCTSGYIRHRTRTCMGSDGEIYNESLCEGTCLDNDPVIDYNYPVAHSWQDSFYNSCEDYRMMAFCTGSGGFGPKWQNSWGSYQDWVTSGENAGQACCLCGGGSNIDPHTEEECPSVPCPSDSSGTSVLWGCTCDAGFSGTIGRSAVSPYYTGSCSAVPCPAHSSGESVPVGCTCNDGYIGSIIPTGSAPFYNGSCESTSTTVSFTSSSTSMTATSSSSLTSTRTQSTSTTNSLTATTATSSATSSTMTSVTTTFSLTSTGSSQSTMTASSSTATSATETTSSITSSTFTLRTNTSSTASTSRTQSATTATSSATSFTITSTSNTFSLTFTSKTQSTMTTSSLMTATVTSSATSFTITSTSNTFSLTFTSKTQSTMTTSSLMTATVTSSATSLTSTSKTITLSDAPISYTTSTLTTTPVTAMASLPSSIATSVTVTSSPSITRSTTASVTFTSFTTTSSMSHSYTTPAMFATATATATLTGTRTTTATSSVSATTMTTSTAWAATATDSSAGAANDSMSLSASPSPTTTAATEHQSSSSTSFVNAGVTSSTSTSTATSVEANMSGAPLPPWSAGLPQSLNGPEEKAEAAGFEWLALLCLIPLLCGLVGFGYWLHKNPGFKRFFRNLLSRKTKVQQLPEDAEDFEEVLPGWSQGDPDLLQAGQKLLKELGSFVADRPLTKDPDQPGFTGVTPEPFRQIQRMPSSTLDDLQKLLEKWQEEERSQDVPGDKTNFASKLGQLANTAQDVVLENLGVRTFREMRRDIEKAWLELQDVQDATPSTDDCKEAENPTDQEPASVDSASSEDKCANPQMTESEDAEKILDEAKVDSKGEEADSQLLRLEQELVKLFTSHTWVNAEEVTPQRLPVELETVIRRWAEAHPADNVNLVPADLSRVFESTAQQVARSAAQSGGWQAEELRLALEEAWKASRAEQPPSDHKEACWTDHRELRGIGESLLVVVETFVNNLAQKGEHDPTHLKAELVELCDQWFDKHFVTAEDVDVITDKLLRGMASDVQDQVLRHSQLSKEGGSTAFVPDLAELLPSIQEAWHVRRTSAVQDPMMAVDKLEIDASSHQVNITTWQPDFQMEKDTSKRTPNHNWTDHQELLGLGESLLVDISTLVQRHREHGLGRSQFESDLVAVCEIWQQKHYAGVGVTDKQLKSMASAAQSIVVEEVKTGKEDGSRGVDLDFENLLSIIREAWRCNIVPHAEEHARVGEGMRNVGESAADLLESNESQRQKPGQSALDVISPARVGEGMRNVGEAAADLLKSSEKPVQKQGYSAPALTPPEVQHISQPLRAQGPDNSGEAAASMLLDTIAVDSSGKEKSPKKSKRKRSRHKEVAPQLEGESINSALHAPHRLAPLELPNARMHSLGSSPQPSLQQPSREGSEQPSREGSKQPSREGSRRPSQQQHRNDPDLDPDLAFLEQRLNASNRAPQSSREGSKQPSREGSRRPSQQQHRVDPELAFLEQRLNASKLESEQQKRKTSQELQMHGFGVQAISEQVAIPQPQQARDGPGSRTSRRMITGDALRVENRRALPQTGSILLNVSRADAK